MTVFIFDLDGTITSKETLPVIAEHFGVVSEIEQLTHQTIAGNVPFIESFIRRVHVLGTFPVSEINGLLEQIPLYPKLHCFIKEHSDVCFVATGNLEGWVEKLFAKVGCECFCSTGQVENDRVLKLTSILRKETVVERFKSQGHRVVFVGEGNNDMEAMRIADVSIAAGLTHYPAPSVLATADYLVFSEEALCRLLNQLL